MLLVESYIVHPSLIVGVDRRLGNFKFTCISINHAMILNAIGHWIVAIKKIDSPEKRTISFIEITAFFDADGILIGYFFC